VNLLGDNIDTLNENTQTSTDAGKKVGLEADTEKTKHMLQSCPQNTGQNDDKHR
jgi:hypothetical protein